jgi:tetratricopeptide (TPR) repeat protein
MEIPYHLERLAEGGDAGAQFEIGDLYAGAKRYREAEQWYRRAGGIGPQSQRLSEQTNENEGWANYKIAEVFAAEGKFGRAKEFAQRAADAGVDFAFGLLRQINETIASGSEDDERRWPNL